MELKGIPFDEPRDLLDLEIQKQAQEDIECFDALAVAIRCETMSKARLIPLQDGWIRPRPLRGHDGFRRWFLDPTAAEKPRVRIITKSRTGAYSMRATKSIKVSPHSANRLVNATWGTERRR